MGTLKTEVKDVVKEFWYAPMYWPMFIGFEVVANCEKWYHAFILGTLLLVPMIVLTVLMIPINVIVFVFVLIAAIVMAVVNLTRSAIKWAQ